MIWKKVVLIIILITMVFGSLSTVIYANDKIEKDIVNKENYFNINIYDLPTEKQKDFNEVKDKFNYLLNNSYNLNGIELENNYKNIANSLRTNINFLDKRKVINWYKLELNRNDITSNKTRSILIFLKYFFNKDMNNMLEKIDYIEMANKEETDFLKLLTYLSYKNVVEGLSMDKTYVSTPRKTFVELIKVCVENIKTTILYKGEQFISNDVPMSEIEKTIKIANDIILNSEK